MKTKFRPETFRFSFFAVLSAFCLFDNILAEDNIISAENCKILVNFDQSFQDYLNTSFQITQSLPKTDKTFVELKKTFHPHALRIVEKYYFRQRFFSENEKNENLWSQLQDDKKQALVLIQNNKTEIAQSYNPFKIQDLKLENSYLYSSLYTMELLRKDLCRSYLKSVHQSSSRSNLKKDETGRKNEPNSPKIIPVR